MRICFLLSQRISDLVVFVVGGGKLWISPKISKCKRVFRVENLVEKRREKVGFSTLFPLITFPTNYNPHFHRVFTQNVEKLWMKRHSEKPKFLPFRSESDEK